VGVATVGPPKSPIERGDRVVSVGCSNGADPTVMESRVTSLDRYQGPPNIEASGGTQRSVAAGVVCSNTEKGELIGICNNADPEGNEGLYAGLAVIHEELDRIGQTAIYAKQAARYRQPMPQRAELVRGQEPSPITPLRTMHGQSKTGCFPQPDEQKSRYWRLRRRGGFGVICIVRPKEAARERSDPSGRCRQVHSVNWRSESVSRGTGTR